MTNAYLTDWLYVWLFIVAGAALVVLILLFSKLINPSHLTAAKLQPYECGIPPVGNPWQPFAVRYFVFGLLFLVFDVEAPALPPWEPPDACRTVPKPLPQKQTFAETGGGIGHPR